jgi:putative transposase
MHLPHLVPFSAAPLYFLTTCTAERRQLLACAEAHAIVTAVWRNSADHDGWFVGKYVVMPDHVHVFARPACVAKDRSGWCKAWKSLSSRGIAHALKLPPPIWQPDTFDHILRNPSSYSAKWDYVRANPVRAGLVNHADDWPWQGELHSLAF